MAKKASENPPIYVVRIGDKLLGEMQMDHDAIMQFPAEQRIRVDLRTGRVPSRLRFYWAFLREVVRATDCAPSEKALHQVVKMRTGYTDEIIMGGYIVKVPGSIAFDNMDEPEFAVFLENALRFISETYGITPEQIKESGNNPLPDDDGAPPSLPSSKPPARTPPPLVGGNNYAARKAGQ